MTVFLPSALRALLVFFTMAVSAPAAIAQEIEIPNFWDKHERFQKPDINAIVRLKFLTTTDFPPFNFIDRKKRLAGFHVDLSRAICEELDVLQRCQIQALPWDELLPAIKNGNGEAIIAGLAVTADMRKQLAFTRSYMQIPGRFVIRKDTALSAPAYNAIFKKLTGVVKGSSHQAYFAKVFSARKSTEFETRDAALAALEKGEVSAVFTDALSASFWLQSEASDNCCVFLDGAFMSPEFFGNGMAIAVSKDRPELADALNFALYQVNAKGKFAELYLRYFPLGLF
ncbi:MAG: transporter substrate-binding domain-containing protein [Pseudomonadota bacterium]